MRTLNRSDKRLPIRPFGPNTACAMACAICAHVIVLCFSGCASERLAAAAPGGVDLTGDWRLNPNLSDDPDKLLEPQKSAPRKPDSTGPRRRGMGVPGPIPGQSFASNASAASPRESSARESALSGDWAALPGGIFAPGLEQPTPLPPAPPATGSSPGPGPASASPGPAPAGGSPAGAATTTLGRLLQAPERLSIQQKGATVAIRARMPDGSAHADEFTAGAQGTTTYGTDQKAEQRSGWRGPAFVVFTKTNTGWREDDYALDEEGHLIVTSEIKAGRMRQFEIKHVYDRLKS